MMDKRKKERDKKLGNTERERERERELSVRSQEDSKMAPLGFIAGR